MATAGDGVAGLFVFHGQGDRRGWCEAWRRTATGGFVQRQSYRVMQGEGGVCRVAALLPLRPDRSAGWGDPNTLTRIALLRDLSRSRRERFSYTRSLIAIAARQPALIAAVSSR